MLELVAANSPTAVAAVDHQSLTGSRNLIRYSALEKIKKTKRTPGNRTYHVRKSTQIGASNNIIVSPIINRREVPRTRVVEVKILIKETTFLQTDLWVGVSDRQNKTFNVLALKTKNEITQDKRYL